MMSQNLTIQEKIQNEFIQKIKSDCIGLTSIYFPIKKRKERKKNDKGINYSRKDSE